MNYEAHEYAELFPLATDAELAGMAADIKARGLMNPIILLDGRILDGRNRYAACAAAGVEPQFREYAGRDPLGDVVAWDLHRRQLTVGQRAAVALKLKPMLEVRAKRRMSDGAKGVANLPHPGKSRDQAAAAVGVSGRTVQDLEAVQQAAPELAAKGASGEMTVHAARRKVKAKKKEVTERKEGSQPKRKSSAMEHAADAIRELRKIGKTDPARREAFRTVKRWVTDNE
jgi:ParB-like chromosome segregation protein Spo0J